MPEQRTFTPGDRVWVNYCQRICPGRFERMAEDGRAEIALTRSPASHLGLFMNLRWVYPRSVRIEHLDPQEEPDRV